MKCKFLSFTAVIFVRMFTIYFGSQLMRRECVACTIFGAKIEVSDIV